AHLAAEGSSLDRAVVHLVDSGAGDALCHLALTLPGEMEELPQLSQVTDQERPLHVVREDLQPVHCVDALDAACLVVPDLVPDNVVRKVSLSDVGEDQAMLELPDRLRAEPEGDDQHCPARLKLD